jgi:uncharacterized membrane protein
MAFYKIKAAGFSPVHMIIVAVVLGVIGQLLSKRGLNLLGHIDFSANLINAYAKILLYVITGALIYVLSIFLWLYGLSKVDLSFAYPFLALSYVLIVFVSWLFLNKRPLAPVDWRPGDLFWGIPYFKVIKPNRALSRFQGSALPYQTWSGNGGSLRCRMFMLPPPAVSWRAWSILSTPNAPKFSFWPGIRLTGEAMKAWSGCLKPLRPAWPSWLPWVTGSMQPRWIWQILKWTCTCTIATVTQMKIS